MSQDQKRVFTVCPEGGVEYSENKPRADRARSSSDVAFLTHLLSLKSAALINMGLIQHEGEEADLEAAAHLIDLLTAIREKTQGNLNQEEEQTLSSSIYELQLAYMKVKSK